MDYNAFIKSLNIEENIFELTEDTTTSYLVHYAAPCTGNGEYQIKAGTRFMLGGPMNEYSLYMRIQGENKEVFQEMIKTEKEALPELADTPIMGFSFYITKYELQNPFLKFISGSRERSLEIIKLIAEYRSNSSKK